MPVTASDYQSLKLQIKGLEEIVAELKSDNEAKAKIIAEQAKLIEELRGCPTITQQPIEIIR